MRLNKSLADAVAFARFCREHQCDPAQLAQLIAQVQRSKSAYERNNFEAHEKHRDEAEKLAFELGFEADWPGLYPILRKDGRDYFLPIT